MPTPINEVVHFLRSAVLPPEEAGLTDGQLLGRFLERRDQAAVAALVQRHGPMVWGVCRRLLPNPHDAEDAFQATFLVLVRKAASVKQRELVGHWLHGVARQTALKARVTAARRRTRERQGTTMPDAAAPEQDGWTELQPVLDQELSRLPERYRVAIVLCDLGGKSRKEAAQQLGVPEGTLAGRLRRGRALLAKRLARHGLALTGGALAAILAQQASAAPVPAAVMSSTIKAATVVAAGQAATAGLVSAKAAALSEGVMKAMLLSKLKLVAAFVLLLALTGVGAGHLLLQTRAAQSPTAPQANEERKTPKTKDTAQAKPSKDDVGRLQGTWRLVSAENDGVRIGEGRPEIKDTFLIFNKSSVTSIYKLIHDPRIKKEPEDAKDFGSFTLDTQKKPKVIVFSWHTFPRLDKAYFQRGIYALDGDNLTLCLFNLSKSKQGPLPTEFSANAGSKRLLWIFKRVPSSEKGGAKKHTKGAGEKKATDNKEQLKRALKRFIGTWKVQSAILNGKGELPKEERDRNERVVYDQDGGWQQVSEGQTVYAGVVVAISTMARPGTIDYKILKGGPDAVGKTIRAIYEFLDDDTYRICCAAPGKDRPADFSRKGYIVAVFKRVKEEQQRKQSAPAKETEEKDKLQGTWQLVTCETDGLRMGEGRPELKDNRLVIEQNSLTFCMGSKRTVAAFTLDAKQTPKVIVLKWREGPWNGKKDFVKAIYAVDGDSLKLCWKDGAKEAPKEFSANTGSKRLLWIFKRHRPPQSATVPPRPTGKAKSAYLFDFRKLQMEMAKLQQSVNKEYLAAKSVKEQEAIIVKESQILREKGWPLAEKALALVQPHATDKEAVKVLTWIIRSQPDAPAAITAAELLARHHLEDPQTLDTACAFHRAPMVWTEKLLRKLADAHVPRNRKARALVALADCAKSKADMRGMLSMLKNLDPVMMKVVEERFGKEHLAKLRAADPAKLEDEAVRRFKEVAQKYGTEKYGSQPIKEYAAGALFEMRHLAVGKQAPDIAGEDIDGKKFKLSDYRGKVVVLDFWGNW